MVVPVIMKKGKGRSGSINGTSVVEVEILALGRQRRSTDIILLGVEPSLRRTAHMIPLQKRTARLIALKTIDHIAVGTCQ